MKTFSDEVVTKEQIQAVRDEVTKIVKDEVAKLRADVVTAHFWTAVSITASLVVSLLILFLVLHH